MSDENTVRTSIVTKRIARKLNTAQYETLEISEEWQETIEWTDYEERARKLQNWERLQLDWYKETHDRVLDALGLGHKKAFAVEPNNKPNISPPQAKKSGAKTKKAERGVTASGNQSDDPFGSLESLDSA